ncbi:MAG: PASTA domain-containing protein [Syntrophorhabdaceae bacterium]|nr:PASTA domain-containing protein [Syntrophorhabdaceae bacterium]
MKLIKIVFYIVAPIFVFGLSTYLTISLVLKFQQTTICPDVRGKTVENARELLRKQGLALVVLRYERRNDVPYNHITVQKPDANISTKKGRVVYVIVSEGPELMKTPGFLGLTLEEAQPVFSEKHLALEKTVMVPHPKTGKIIAQLPPQGTDILEYGKVTLFVGTAPRSYYLMADTRNINYNELADELESKGIRYRINYARADRASSRNGIEYSILPRTIFNSTEEIVINIY